MSFRSEVPFHLANEELIADASGALFWPKADILFMADLHVGKTNHFRKAGIPIPMKVETANLNRLDETLQKYAPDQVFFLGDLFHSEHNQSWEQLGQLLSSHSNTTFHLIEGNHDILDKNLYAQFNIQYHAEGLILDPFALYHHPTLEKGYHALAGHLHPGVILEGKGKQRLRLSCFWSTEDITVLPAFGTFKGKHIFQPKKGDQVMVITKDGIIRM